VANVLRDRFQLENLRKRMPRDHPAYNQATALLEVRKFYELKVLMCLFVLEYKMAKLID
jgi:hypothetical protein